MALRYADRVLESSTSTGTGTLDLDGAQAGGYQTFVAGIGGGNTCYYSIANPSADEWEVGLGTVTDAATDTLARTTVLASSNAGAAVNFSAGTKDVFCVRPANGGSLVVPPSAVIQGDWSGALGTRTRLETLTTNSNTTVHVTPNGAGSTGAIALNNASDEANAAAALVGCNGTEAYFQCTSWGTGSTLPIKVKIDGATRLEIETNGTLNVAGTTTYEALVTHDDDIPNKKYVDDAILAYEVVTDLTPQLGGDLDTNNNKILFNDTTSYAVETATPVIQVNGSIGTSEAIGIYHWSQSAGAHQSALAFARSRNNTIGTHQAVINNDSLGAIEWHGSDGTHFLLGAELQANATGTWTATDNRSEIRLNVTRQNQTDTQLAFRITDTGTTYTGFRGNDLRGAQHGSMTVHTGNSGATAALTSADELLVEAGSNGGITVFTPDDNTGKLVFGSASDNDSASVEWTYGAAGATTQLDIGTNVTGGKITFYTGANAQALEIESDGTLNVSGITDYEDLVTADDDIPNKKYVDDAVAAGGSGFTITTTAVNKTLANLEKCSVTASGRTITLPATPSNGYECWVSVGNFTDTTVARNGSTIRGVADDATINLAYQTVVFYYNGSTWLTRP